VIYPAFFALLPASLAHSGDKPFEEVDGKDEEVEWTYNKPTGHEG
jgi:hypothetical protein